MTGVGLGARNLSLGCLVMKSSPLTELSDALRFLSDFSAGSVMMLTVCPGKNGQAEVDGRFGS